MRPTRSPRRVPASHTVSPFSIVPEYTLRYVSRPVGVAFTLNASAAIGAAGSAGRTCSVPSWVPRTAGTSSGEGRYATTASSSGSTPRLR